MPDPAAIVEVMRRVHAIDVSAYDLLFLSKSADQRLRSLEFPGVTAYLEHLERDREEAEALARSLEIHHSELFRDPLTFALLEQRILPALATTHEAGGKKELRVWSAGCAAGQEAYSVAILLLEQSELRERPVPFRLFATDRSEAQLAQARAAAYPAAAMGNVRLSHLDRWFSCQQQTYVAAPGLCDQIDFSIHDLLGEHSAPPASIFASFDLVLCCNLLFYYRPNVRQLVLDRLRHTLAPGGYLVTGEVERDFVADAGGFRPVNHSATTFQRTT